MKQIKINFLRLCRLRFYVLLTFICSTVAISSDGQVGAQDTNNIGLRVQTEDFSEFRLPEKPVFISALSQLDYSEEMTPEVLKINLDADTIPEFVIKGSKYLCGSGGCPYIIIDGSEEKIIAEIFGGIIYISDDLVNGYRILYTFTHRSAFSGQFSMYLFGENNYKRTLKMDLSEDSVKSFLENFKEYKRL